MKYAFIKGQRDTHKVVTMCRVLQVSTTGYYDWLARPESRRSIETRRLTAKIREFHRASRRTYGSPRIFKDLRESGESCSVNRTARLMRQAQCNYPLKPVHAVVENSIILTERSFHDEQTTIHRDPDCRAA